MKTLKVRASGTAMVPDYDALDGRIRRFIGRRFDAEIKGFVPLAEAVTVSARAEHRQAVKDGDLEAADAETAKLCGVTFIPLSKFNK